MPPPKCSGASDSCQHSQEYNSQPPSSFNMKFVIVLAFALFAVAAARPNAVEIVRQNSDVGVESYNYGLETSDGTKKEEKGELKNLGHEDEAIVVHGSYSFVADDGVTYTVTYVADENGFQPSGAHLPVAPAA
ncbi:larval cuticle protein 65Ag1-like [Drosophila subobscura]|nr:larval cuticle protein 65Ag1-like [Drosophila subobscura]